MKLSVAPQGLLERAVFALGIVPTPLLYGFWGMGVSRVLIDGTRLGIFEALANGPKSAGEVAQAVGCDPKGTETLLDALNGFGFVRRRRGLYRNSRATDKWMLESSRRSFREAMFFYADLWDAMGHIEDGVRTGKPVDFHHSDRPAEFWEHYMRSLAGFAKMTGAEIARRVRFDGEIRRLLDVAGGHGAYSMAFCNKYPELQAEVMDLPQAAAFGRQIVEEAGMSGRVSFRDSDMREADWGSGYDAVLLFNILHNVSVDEARAALAAAQRALRPGGTLVVYDSEHTGGENDLSTTSGFNELFFFVVSGTQAYPEGTIMGWMREAGFGRLKRRRVFSVPDSVVLTGRA